MKFYMHSLTSTDQQSMLYKVEFKISKGEYMGD